MYGSVAADHRYGSQHYNLVVEFVGEEGVDAGAIRGDFFEQLMVEIDNQLFEGDHFRRILKKV